MKSNLSESIKLNEFLTVITPSFFKQDLLFSLYKDKDT